MKTTAVIAEYNPFHNGHRYQLDAVRRTSDAVIVIMSGAFVQRGAAAVFDKWIRAEAAILNGADLVLELPTAYALSTAQRFATGAVHSLELTGVVDELCFGAETADAKLLEDTARILEEEPEDFTDPLKKGLSKGLSYPAARSAALPPKMQGLLSSPNNILAVEYIRALIRLKSRIRPFPLLRKDAAHHDAVPSGNIASATALRTLIENGGDYAPYVPPSSFSLYKNAPVYDTARLDTAILARLRLISAHELSRISDVTEGLENRLKAAAAASNSIGELLAAVKTKRYPLSRLRRILLYTLLGIEGDISASIPDYLRILGMNDTGKRLLAEIKRSSPLPIVTKTANFTTHSKKFLLDLKSSDLAALCCRPPEKAGLDFLRSPVIL